MSVVLVDKRFTSTVSHRVSVHGKTKYLKSNEYIIVIFVNNIQSASSCFSKFNHRGAQLLCWYVHLFIIIRVSFLFQMVGWSVAYLNREARVEGSLNCHRQLSCGAINCWRLCSSRKCLCFTESGLRPARARNSRRFLCLISFPTELVSPYPVYCAPQSKASEYKRTFQLSP